MRIAPRLSPIGSLNVGRAVYEKLREAIINHTLKAGEQISVKELARDMAVSSTPVVQALQRLADEGLVTVYPRKGVVVSDPTLEEIREVSETREALETYATRLAAPKMTDADLEGLQVMLDDWKELLSKIINGEGTGDVETLDHLDSDFHCRLVELAGNDYLLAMYAKVDSRVRASIRAKVGGFSAHAEHLGSQEHDRILLALRERDAEGAAEAVRRHIWGAYHENAGRSGEQDRQVSLGTDDSTLLSMTRHSSS